MAKQFDWDEFLQSVTNGTPEYYKSRLTEFVRYDLHVNDIVAPDNGLKKPYCYAKSLMTG